MATRVVILGGGFGGTHAALTFDHAKDPGFEVTLIDRNNFFLFTPMLSEIASSAIDTRHIVNPFRRMFRRVRFIEADIERVDLDRKRVHVRLPSGSQSEVGYDHLLVSLGSSTNYFSLPGVEEHSVGVKTLADAIVLRNRVIQRLEQADVLPREVRGPLLTFVVAGGGPTGVEVAGDLNDFLREASHVYHTIEESEIQVILVEAGPRLMPELPVRLAGFALKQLRKRGAVVHLNAPVHSATADTVTVGGIGAISTRNLVWTAGVAPSDFSKTLGVPLTKGRIATDEFLRVPGLENVWAVGDAALIPNGRGGYQPMLAQHALREGRHVAKNIMAASYGRFPRPFRYRTKGMLTTVGHRSGVGTVFGIRVSGILAWWMWRTYYLLQLPRLDKKVRVAIDWTLDMVFPRDIVQLQVFPSQDVTQTPGDKTPSSTPSG